MVQLQGLRKHTAIYRAKTTITCIVKYLRHTHLHLAEYILYCNLYVCVKINRFCETKLVQRDSHSKVILFSDKCELTFKCPVLI